MVQSPPAFHTFGELPAIKETSSSGNNKRCAPSLWAEHREFPNFTIRSLLFYGGIVLVYLLFQEGSGPYVLPGLFSQLFFLLGRYKPLRVLCRWGLALSMLLHLSLSPLALESLLCLALILFGSLVVLDKFLEMEKEHFREFHLHLAYSCFVILFYLLDPALAFWGLCLTFNCWFLYTIEYLTEGKRESALCALYCFLLLSVFLLAGFLHCDMDAGVIRHLFAYFKVKTLGELLLLCGLVLMSGASVTFFSLDTRGERAARTTFLLHFFFSLCLGCFCFYFHGKEMDIWVKEFYFILICYLFYPIGSVFLLKRSIKETLPLFFLFLALGHSRLYVLLSPGIQSWVLGLGALTILIEGARRLLLRDSQGLK